MYIYIDEYEKQGSTSGRTSRRHICIYREREREREREMNTRNRAGCCLNAADANADTEEDSDAKTPMLTLLTKRFGRKRLGFQV
jgi:hypothetical protein